MTWLHKPLLICILMGAAAALCLVGPARADGIWSEYAMVSATLGVSDSRICIGEGSRGDLGCPGYAPYIAPNGYLGIGTSAPSMTLTVSGSSAFTNGLYINYARPFVRFEGVSVTSLVMRNSGNIALSTNALAIGNGGTALGFEPQAALDISGTIRVANSGEPCDANRTGAIKYQSGDFYYCRNGTAWESLSSLSGGGGAAGDRLTSGTLAVTANSATAIVSLSTGGTTWGYLGSAGSYLPSLTSSKVSATTISTTAVQVVSATAPLTCDSGKAGTLRYNSTNTALELCTGTGWQMMGVGIPAGTISAFASTTCPTGWSEYTPARGRFLRGIDNGAGNDPAGTRTPGNTQTDAFQGHHHLNKYSTAYSGYGTSGNGWQSNFAGSLSDGTSSQAFITTPATDGTNGVPRTSSETRPKNVAVTYCQFNGTSNGWNNPLSGGSTVPGGSTGQIQYNTGGSFDASAGLTYDNANSRLTTVNISATALTVNGVPITGSASGDRIVSGSTSVLASPSGTIAVSGSLNVSGAVVGESFTVSTTVNMRNNPSATCVSGTLGAVTQINSKLYFCRP